MLYLGQKVLKKEKNHKTSPYHKRDISDHINFMNRLFLHDISIHTNFHQNRSMNFETLR